MTGETSGNCLQLAQRPSGRAVQLDKPDQRAVRLYMCHYGFDQMGQAPAMIAMNEYDAYGRIFFQDAHVSHFDKRAINANIPQAVAVVAARVVLDHRVD